MYFPNNVCGCIFPSEVRDSVLSVASKAASGCRTLSTFYFKLKKNRIFQHSCLCLNYGILIPIGASICVLQPFCSQKVTSQHNLREYMKHSRAKNAKVSPKVKNGGQLHKWPKKSNFSTHLPQFSFKIYVDKGCMHISDALPYVPKGFNSMFMMWQKFDYLLQKNDVLRLTLRLRGML